MTPWTLLAAAWPAAALALAVTIGRGIRTADREAAAARDRFADRERARIVSRYPSVTLDGRVPHHIAVRVFRSAQTERVGL